MAVEPRPRAHGAPRPGAPSTVRGMLTLEELEHLNYGRTEQRRFSQVVADYERRRAFERD